MKNRVLSLLMCAIIAVVAVSCNGNLSDGGQLSVTCKTKGFVGNNETTAASWCSGEKIMLLRADDWLGATMSLASGAGTSSATFKGELNAARDGYYAVRPASAAGAMRSNGSIELTVEPNNVFFAEDNSSVVVPQIGQDKKKNVEFKSCFGALKFNIVNASSVSSVQVSVPGKEQGLYGSFAYYFKRDLLVGLATSYDLQCNFEPAVDISSSRAVYVALPEGSYSTVSLLVGDSKTGKKEAYRAQGVSVQRGRITNVSTSSYIEVPALVGSWHIKSYCGLDAPVDLYIDFAADGRFTILQRTEMSGYRKFEGTYSVDSQTSVVSGVYSDGEPWSNSYKYSIDENMNLVLVNTTLASEVSVYEPSNMPSGAAAVTKSGVKDVKPL